MAALQEAMAAVRRDMARLSEEIRMRDERIFELQQANQYMTQVATAAVAIAAFSTVTLTATSFFIVKALFVKFALPAFVMVAVAAVVIGVLFYYFWDIVMMLLTMLWGLIMAYPLTSGLMFLLLLWWLRRLFRWDTRRCAHADLEHTCMGS
jgi:hypothetical protein